MAKLPDYKADINDPFVLNSVTDLIFNKGGFDKRYGTDSSLIGRVAALPVTVFDSILWEQTAKPIIGNVVNAVQQAQAEQRNPFGAGLRGLGAGLQTAGWNALGNLSETLDVIANPVKAAVIETVYHDTQGRVDWGAQRQGDVWRGIKTSLGMYPELGRPNYDYETGNIFADLGLEIVSDPLNLVSFGASSSMKKALPDALRSTAAKTGISLTDEAVELAAKKLHKSAVINKKLDYSVLEGVFKNLNVPDSFYKALAENLPESFTAAQKWYNISEGIQSGLMRTALGASGVTLPYRAVRGAYRTIRDQRELRALNKGVLQASDLPNELEDLFKNKRYKVVERTTKNAPNAPTMSRPAASDSPEIMELKRLRSKTVNQSYTKGEGPVYADAYIHDVQNLTQPSNQELFKDINKTLKNIGQRLADPGISLEEVRALKQKKTFVETYQSAVNARKATDILTDIKVLRDNLNAVRANRGLSTVTNWYTGLLERVFNIQDTFSFLTSSTGADIKARADKYTATLHSLLKKSNPDLFVAEVGRYTTSTPIEELLSLIRYMQEEGGSVGNFIRRQIDPDSIEEFFRIKNTLKRTFKDDIFSFEDVWRLLEKSQTLNPEAFVKEYDKVLSAYFSFPEAYSLFGYMNATYGSIEKFIAESPDVATLRQYFILKSAAERIYQHDIISFSDYWRLLTSSQGDRVNFAEDFTTTMLTYLNDMYALPPKTNLINFFQTQASKEYKRFNRLVNELKTQPGFKDVAVLERFKNVTERLRGYPDKAPVADVTNKAYQYLADDLVYKLNDVIITEDNYRTVISDFIDSAKSIGIWDEAFPEATDIRSMEDARRFFDELEEWKTAVWKTRMNSTAVEEMPGGVFDRVGRSMVYNGETITPENAQEVLDLFIDALKKNGDQVSLRALFAKAATAAEARKQLYTAQELINLFVRDPVQLIYVKGEDFYVNIGRIKDRKLTDSMLASINNALPKLLKQMLPGRVYDRRVFKILAAVEHRKAFTPMQAVNFVDRLRNVLSEFKDLDLPRIERYSSAGMDAAPRTFAENMSNDVLELAKDFLNFNVTTTYSPKTFASAEGMKVYTIKYAQVNKLLEAMSDDSVISLAHTIDQLSPADLHTIKNTAAGEDVLKIFEAFREAREFLEELDALSIGGDRVLSLEQSRAIVDILSSKENVSLEAYLKDPKKFLDILFDKASLNASMSDYIKLDTLEAWASQLGITTSDISKKYANELSSTVAKDHDALIDVLKTAECIKADPAVAAKITLQPNTWVYDIETTGLSKRSGRISQLTAYNPATGAVRNFYVRTTEVPSNTTLRKLGLSRDEFVIKYAKSAEVPSDTMLRKAGLTAQQYRDIHNGPGSVSLEEALNGLLDIIKEDPTAKFIGFNNTLFDHEFVNAMLGKGVFPLDLMDKFITAQQEDAFKIIKEIADYPFFTDTAKLLVSDIIEEQARKMEAIGAPNLFQTVDLTLTGKLRQLSSEIEQMLSRVPPSKTKTFRLIAEQADEASRAIPAVFGKRSYSSNSTGMQLEDSLAFFAFKEKGQAREWVTNTLNIRRGEWLAAHPNATAEQLAKYLQGEEKALLNAIIPADNNIISFMGDILNNTHVFSANRAIDMNLIIDFFGEALVNSNPYQWSEMTALAKRLQKTVDNTVVADLLYSIKGQDALPGLHQFIKELQTLFIDDFRKSIPINENNLMNYAFARNLYNSLTSSETLQRTRFTDEAARDIAEKYSHNPIIKTIIDPVKDVIEDAFTLADDSALARYRTTDFFGSVQRYIDVFQQDTLKAVSRTFDAIDASATGAQHLRPRLEQASRRVQGFYNEVVAAMREVPEESRNHILNYYSADLIKHQYRRITKALTQDFELFKQYLYHQAGGTMLIMSDDLKVNAKLLDSLKEAGIHYSKAGKKHLFLIDKDYLEVFKNLPQPENLTVFTNLKDVAIDKAAEVAKVLNTARAELMGVGDTLGDLITPQVFDELQGYIPSTLVGREINWDTLKATGWTAQRRFNNSIIAQTGADRMAAKVFAPVSVIKNTVNGLVDNATHVDTKAKFLSLYFNPEMTVRSSPIFQRIPQEEVRQLLIKNSEYRLVWVDKMQHVHEVSPRNADLFNKAIEQGATIVTAQSYGKMYKVLNQPEIDNEFVKALQRVTVLYKVGYLGSLGFLVRNLLDGITKNKLTMQDSVSVPKVISHMLDTTKVYLDYSDIVRDMTEFATANKRRWSKSLFDDYFAQVSSTKLDREFFELVHEFIQDGPSGGLTKELQAFLDNASGIAKDSDKFYAIVNKLPYFSQLSTANGNLESIMRLSLYLQLKEMGGTTTDAIQKVIKTHFNYNDKSVAQLYTEVLFPFIGFSLKNMEYYLDAVKEYGGFASYLRALLNAGADLDQYHAPEWIDFEEHDRTPGGLFDTPNTGVDISPSVLYHVLAGNLIFGDPKESDEDSRKDLFKVLKLNPSVMDAFNFGMSPISNMAERLLPMFSYPIERYLNDTADSITIADYIYNTLPVWSSLTYRKGQVEKNAEVWGAPILPSLIGVATAYKRFDPDNLPASLTLEQKYTWFAQYKAGNLPEKFNPCNYDLYPQYTPEPIDPANPYTLNLDNPALEKQNRWQVADWFAAYKYKDLPAEYNPYRYYPQFSKYYNEKPLDISGLPAVEAVTDEQMKTWYSVYKLHNLPEEYNPYRHYPQFGKSKGGAPRSVRNSAGYRQMKRIYDTKTYRNPSVGYLRQHNRVRNMVHRRHKISVGTANYRASQRMGFGLTPDIYQKASHRINPFI